MTDSALSIALVGMAGRFPGANDLGTFWRNLCDGVESITFFEEEELRRAGVPPELLKDPRYVPARGVLEGAELFDAPLFGFTPREAETTDPQQRIFLEVAWEALEAAGYGGADDGRRVGVYAGLGLSSYLQRALADPEIAGSVGHLGLALGNDKDFLATRVAYKLGLDGPAIGVQTACSTSLVAVHLACQALLGGECDMALAGGASIALPQVSGYLYHDGGILSPDGHCRAFDARARGAVRGSGAGVVVLKRLEDALADGDLIRAVILGSAVNNDGSARVGFTAPSVDGQTAVIRTAYEAAGIDPASLSYVEAHGTGTELGDPVEVEALTRAFRAAGAGRDARCALGSVKTNVGHLDAAAGVAGLIKTALALEHGRIPPSLHFERPNPQIDFEASPFRIQTTLADWPAVDGPRRAAVSSFGMGGTNAHLVLEQAPPRRAADSAQGWHLLVVSAHTPTALDRAGRRLAEAVSCLDGGDLADAAYTLQVGRRSLRHRRAVVCRRGSEAAAALVDTPAPSAATDGGRRAVAFLVPGQGAQRPGAGSELYALEPRFRQVIDHCCEHLEGQLQLDLRELLFPSGDDRRRAAKRLRDTRFTQPAQFVLAYALARLWQAWGVEPDSLFGHSVGEYVAACLCGTLQLDHALDLVAIRGRLLSELPAGGMVAIALPEDEVVRRLPPGLSLAAVNGPAQCVASGEEADVESLVAELEREGVWCRRLETSHPFHSRLVEPAMAPLEEAVARVPRSRPARPWISGVTGSLIRPEDATDPSYWARHLRRPVRFADALDTLFREPRSVLLEVGAGRTLTALARRHPDRPEDSLVLASLPRCADGAPAAAELLEAAGRLWSHGVALDWPSLHQPFRRRRVALPTYPFEGEAYLLPPAAERWAESAAVSPPAVTARRWYRSDLPGPVASAPPVAWLLVGGEHQLLAAVDERLRARGRKTFTAPPGRSPAPAQALGEPWGILDLRWAGPGASEEDPMRGGDGDGDGAGEEDWIALAQAHGDGGAAAERLVVACRGAFALLPGELPSPVAAARLARVRHLGAPGLTVRAIDLDPSGEPTGTADSLVEELERSDAPVVALRGGVRWLPDRDPVTGDPAARTDPSRRAGVVLLAGDWTAERLPVAEAMARRLRPANVVLAPAGSWRGAERRSESREEGPLPPDAEVEEHERRIARSVEVRPLSSRPGFLQALDEMIARRLLEYLRGRGVDVRAGALHDRASLERRLGIRPRYAKLLDHAVALLVEQGWARKDGDRIEILPGHGSSSVESLADRLRSAYPDLRWVVDTVDRAISSYPDALSGQAEAVGVLFPGGEVGRRAGRDQFLEIWDRAVYLPLLACVVPRWLDGRGRRRPRILEVGGGTGALTRQLVSTLGGREYEYHFTDIGKLFVLRAERWAAEEGLDQLELGLLDVSRDPVEQGFEEASFDCVVGLDVVHATADLRETVGHLARLLRPGGLMALVESLRVDRWTHLSAGLAEGWWYFDDDLREESPLVGLDVWERVLRSRGLNHVRSYPRGTERRRHAQAGLVLGEAPHRPPTGLDDRLHALRCAGVDLHVRPVESTDRTAWERLLLEVEGEMGELRGVAWVATSVRPVPPGDLRALDHALDRRDLPALALVSSLPGEERETEGLTDFLDALARRRAARGPFPCWQIVAGGGGAPALARAAHWLLSDPRLPGLRVAREDSRREVERERPGTAPPARRHSLHGRPALPQPPVPPRNDTERRLVALCCDVLGMEEIGVRDDLFELGFDSLLAVQLLARMQDAFGVELPMRTFLEAPSVEAMATRLTAQGPAERQPVDEVLPRVGAAVGPLTPMEYRLWSLERRIPERARCVVPVGLELRGALDERALAEALREAVRRHTALRTVYPASEGRPFRRVLPESPPEVWRVDLGALAAPARNLLDWQPLRHVVTMGQRPFDVARGPLLRVVLARLGPTRHVLLYVMHHLVCDGYSLALFERDLSELYSAYAAGRDVRLPLPALQYPDFAHWLDRRLADGRGERLVERCRRRLEGATWELNLPWARPRPPRNSFHGASLSFRLPEKLSSALRGAARRHRTTLFELTLTAYEILLGLLAGRREVVVAFGVSGRSRPELEEVLGLFVNTVILRTDLSGDPSVAALLGRVREGIAEARGDQEVPMETLLDQLLEERDLERNAFVEIQFGLQSFTQPEAHLEGLETVRLPVENPAIWNDLSLYLAEGRRQISGTVRYRTDLFDEPVIRRLATAYRHVLEQVVDDPHQPLSRIRLERAPSSHPPAYPASPAPAGSGT